MRTAALSRSMVCTLRNRASTPLVLTSATRLSAPGLGFGVGWVRAGAAANDLTAREHRGRKRAHRRKYQDQDRAGGGLLERLEEGLRRVGRHAIRVVHDEDLAQPHGRPERGPALQLANLVDADGPGPTGVPLGRRGHDQMQVGMLALGHERARAAMAAAPSGRSRARTGGPPRRPARPCSSRPGRPHQGVGVRNTRPGQSAAEEGNSPRLSLDHAIGHADSPPLCSPRPPRPGQAAREARISRTRLGSARRISR